MYKATLSLAVRDIEEEKKGEPGSSKINDSSNIDPTDSRQPGEETSDNAILSQPVFDEEERFVEYAQITHEFEPPSPAVHTDFNSDKPSVSAQYSGVDRVAAEYAQLTSETRSPPPSAIYTELKQKNRVCERNKWRPTRTYLC